MAPLSNIIISIILILPLMRDSSGDTVGPSSTDDVTTTTTSSCSYIFTGERNVIFLIDVSESVNVANVNKSKDFLRDFIVSSLVLDEDNVQLCVIAFSEISRVEVSLVHDAGYLTQCELLLPDGLWDTSLRYKHENGQDLSVAFQTALDQMEKGKQQRPNAKEDLIIISDAENIFDKTFTSPHNKLLSRATVYGLGTGTYLNTTAFKSIVTSEDCYQNLTGGSGESYAAERPGAISTGDDFHPLRDVVDPSACGETCMSCTCNDFTSPVEFNCIAHHPEIPPFDSGIGQGTDRILALICVFIAVVVCGILSGGILFICYRWRVCEAKPKKPKEDGPSPTVREDDSSARDAGSNPGDIYANELVHRVLEANANVQAPVGGAREQSACWSEFSIDDDNVNQTDINEQVYVNGPHNDTIYANDSSTQPPPPPPLLPPRKSFSQRMRGLLRKNPMPPPDEVTYANRRRSRTRSIFNFM